MSAGPLVLPLTVLSSSSRALRLKIGLLRISYKPHVTPLNSDLADSPPNNKANYFLASHKLTLTPSQPQLHHAQLPYSHCAVYPGQSGCKTDTNANLQYDSLTNGHCGLTPCAMTLVAPADQQIAEYSDFDADLDAFLLSTGTPELETYERLGDSHTLADIGEITPDGVVDKRVKLSGSEHSASDSIAYPYKKFYCHYDSCGKSFTTSGHLSRHNRIHTGEKRFKCPIGDCTARFSRQDNCNQHVKTHDQGRQRLSRRSSTRTSTCPSDHEDSARHLAPIASDYLHRTPSSSSRATSQLTDLSMGQVSPDTKRNPALLIDNLFDTAPEPLLLQPPSLGYNSATEEEDHWHFLTDGEQDWRSYFDAIDNPDGSFDIISHV